jgi:two-component system alkaline phosphatase synthesis response regulator PhoP
VDSSRVLILAKESETIRNLENGLIRRGYNCNVVSSEKELADIEFIDLLMIDVENGMYSSALEEMIQRIKQGRNIYTVLLADKEILQDIENDANIDDFILKPYDLNEVLVRTKRLLGKQKPREESAEYLKAGDIIIDLPRCEVQVKGRVVDLTFTEYELLKALMSKKGHVITREVLLNKIWGYDYFGGDRTVDVHITRLRNKIEDPSHSFIETVRNIGYRVKANDKR